MTCVHNEDATTRHGRLIVLCGPAGVGKGTVLGRNVRSIRESGYRYRQLRVSHAPVRWMA